MVGLRLRQDGELHVWGEAEAVAAVAESVAEDGEVNADEEGFVACFYSLQLIRINILIDVLEEQKERKGENTFSPLNHPPRHLPIAEERHLHRVRFPSPDMSLGNDILHT